MTYKKHVTILAILAGLLACIYAAVLVFSPDRVNARSASYRWLDPKWIGQVDRLEIRGAESLTLQRKDGSWYTAINGMDYPVKEARVEDLLHILSASGTFPQRGSTASHERLGLTEESASRIIAWGGAGNLPLLDLFIGVRDASGRDVYLRKGSQAEVRSGEDRFSSYVNEKQPLWYNLRLLPDSASLSLDAVQRVTVIAPSEDDSTPPPLVLSRREQGWVVEGLAPESLDNSRIGPYIRSILDAEGDTFITAMTAQDPVFNEGRIAIDFGDGTSRRISLGPSFKNGDVVFRSAVISGSKYVYRLTEWTVERLFRNASYFERQ